MHALNPYYGVERFAIDLEWSEEKARRIRNLAGITAAKRSKKHRNKSFPPEITVPDNALKPYIEYKDMERPWTGASFNKIASESGAWAQDFTHINYRGVWVYLATVVDLLTRRILGWSVGLRHTKELVHDALMDALSDNPAPPILHDDQGSEYLSHKMRETCERHNIQLSCSDPGNPWQNGFQESLYRGLKDELGNTNRFGSVEELYEAIAGTIYYYNHKRIHTALKMPPVSYHEKLMLAN